MRIRRVCALPLLCLGPLFLTGTLLQAQVLRSHHSSDDPAPSTSEADPAAAAMSTSESGDIGNGKPQPGTAKLEPAGVQAALNALINLRQQYERSGYRQAEANVLVAIANSHYALHQQQRAIEDLEAALAIWRDLGNQQGAALTLAHIGDVYRRWGFPEQANHFYRDALPIYPATEKSGYAATLNNLGLTYFALRDKKRCIGNLNEALAVFRSAGDHRGEAMALVNLGAAFNYLAGDREKALDMFQEAITKLELLGDLASEANALDHEGVVWLNLHKPEMASLTFQHAMAIYQKTGDTLGEAAARRHMEAIGYSGTRASAH